jgi:hypothetical protein
MISWGRSVKDARTGIADGCYGIVGRDWGGIGDE